MNKWISWEVHLLWIYHLRQNTWIPRRINLFSSLLKSPEQKKTFFRESKLFVKGNSTNGGLVQKNTFFTEQLPVAAKLKINNWVGDVCAVSLTYLSHFHWEIIEENVSSEVWGTEPSERFNQASTKKKWISYKVT